MTCRKEPYLSLLDFVLYFPYLLWYVCFQRVWWCIMVMVNWTVCKTNTHISLKLMLVLCSVSGQLMSE